MVKNTAPSTGVDKIDQFKWYYWLVLLASIGLTLGAWHFSKTQVEERNKLLFDKEVNQTLSLITERLQKYENILWSGAGLFNASEEVTLDEWRAFTQTISIDKKYSEIDGVGVIYYIQPHQLESFLKKHRQSQPNFSIFPKHLEKVHMPITYIEPIDINRAEVGLDIAFETNRYTAALNTWKSGKAQITAPITFAQDNEQVLGFLFYVPVYRSGFITNQSNPDGRYALIYASFAMDQLMLGTLAKQKRHIGLSIQDQGKVLYDENSAEQSTYDPNPLLQETVLIPMYGRDWTFKFRTHLGFRALSQNKQPMIILISGLIMNIILFFLLFTLARSNKKAIRYADAVTRDLVKKTNSLEISNKELEHFAYIASHDLKAPIRGIDNLVTWIEEDSQGILSLESQEYILKIKKRIRRMNRLIEGILNYSRIDSGHDGDISEIDVNAILLELKEQYEHNPKININIAQDFPTIPGTAVHFKQVAANLIDNAIKYNDKPMTYIDIGYQFNQGKIIFSFKDNGPGIDQMFHPKIFELFQTLHPKDEYDSTGLGLAIVKKIIEQNGGQIWLTSEVQKETEFFFTWRHDRRVPHAKRS